MGFSDTRTRNVTDPKLVEFLTEVDALVQRIQEELDPINKKLAEIGEKGRLEEELNRRGSITY